MEELGTERPGKLLRRMTKLGILAITGVVAMYGIAGSRGERTPLQMPAGAERLPWPHPNTEAFIVPEGTADQANCGHINTFLGDMYDDSVATAKNIINTDVYRRAYLKTSGNHSDADKAMIRLSFAEVPDGQVVLCPSAPSVRYIAP